MKKYTVEKPLTTNLGKLLLNGDVILTEEVRSNLFKVYIVKSREYMGYITSTNNLKLEKNYGG